MSPPANLLSAGWRRYSHLLAANSINEQHRDIKVKAGYVFLCSFLLICLIRSLELHSVVETEHHHTNYFAVSQYHRLRARKNSFLNLDG